MTTVCAILAASAAILPSDRMAMADRLFDRGERKAARAEYVSLEGEKGIAEDELLYRLAECDRLLGDAASARSLYARLLDRHPLSRHAVRARLNKALCAPDDETKKAELKLLDSDGVENPIRAAALYRYGVLAADPAALAKCAAVDPAGKYALYARFRRAALLMESTDAASRRAAVGELMDLCRAPDGDVARDALYLAASGCYSDKQYSRSSTLFRRYLKQYPQDARSGNARTMAAWSDFLVGRYSDAAALCGEGGTDDLAYLLAACAHATGDSARAKTLMKRYLEDYPAGKYRKAVELPLARMAFEEAGKASDAAASIEAAKRSAAISNASQDRLRLAWAYEKAGRADDAVAAYLAVASDYPGTEDASEALFRKAMIDIRAGRWSPAELSLKEVLSSGAAARRRPQALYWRGVAAHRLGYGAEAGKLLREALAAGGLALDETREAKLILADAAFKDGRIDEAKKAYSGLVREGACERMGAAKIHAVGRFLLERSEGGDTAGDAKTCAKALAGMSGSAEWRQAAYTLMGEAEEALGEYAAAAGSYRQAMAEDVRTEDARIASLRLGVLETRAGEYADAALRLKEAVALNASDAARRAEAYLWLAKNAEASGDFREACSYATVLASLFDDENLAAEARKILEAHPGEAGE